MLPPPIWIALPKANYAIRFSYDYGHLSAMSFRVFRAAETFEGPSNSNTGVWELLDDGGSPRPLDEWENTFWEIDGALKWDGCINWQTNPDCMAHGCGPGHVEDLTAIFQTVYHAGKRHMDLLGDAVKPLPEGAVELTE